MKKTIASIALASALCGSAFAIDGLSVTGSFDFESEYVFRGKRNTQSAFQPSVEVGYNIGGGTAYAGVWTNLPVKSDNAIVQGNEVDFYIGYAFPVTDVFTVDGGFTYYWYPDSVGAGIGGIGVGGAKGYSQSREIYIGVQADVMLSPAVYFYYDFDLEQIVIEGSIGYSLDLAEWTNVNGLSLDAAGYVGWLHADAYNGSQRNGVAKWKNGYGYIGGSIDLVYAFSENLAVSVGARLTGNNDGTSGANTFTGSPQLGRESKLWWGTSVVFAY